MRRAQRAVGLVGEEPGEAAVAARGGHDARGAGAVRGLSVPDGRVDAKGGDGYVEEPGRGKGGEDEDRGGGCGGAGV